MAAGSMRMGRWACAVAIVATASGVASAAVEDDLRDGDRYFEDGAWAKAAAAFDRAIGKAPEQVPAEAYGKRAAIFIIVKDFKGGLAFVDRVRARYPDAPEIAEQEALMLWETDARDRAIAVAEKVVVARPKAFSNQRLLGDWYASRDPVKAAAAYEAYLQYRPADLEAGDVLPRIRLGFADLANARAVLADGDDQHAAQLYAKAADQFDIVEKKFGKKPNAQINADNGLCAADTGLARWDQAVTVCERIVSTPRNIDANGSVWWNLGTAYLARQQPPKARAAALEFTKLRKAEPRGYILLGDTYFAERSWQEALDAYLRADKLTRSSASRDGAQLSIKLGKTYRRLPAPATGANPNLALAIDKLSAGLAGNPSNLDIANELGEAYLDARDDAKAKALADQMIGAAAFGAAPADARSSMYAIAGKAAFGRHDLKDARARFEAAQQLRPADVSIQRDLVIVINEQALEADASGGARTLLDQALAIDGNSPMTIANLAIISIEHNDCDSAQKLLGKLATLRGEDPVLRQRLLARAYVCGSHPDPARAQATYAAAEKAARTANAPLVLAEIYTEWAPLLWDTDPDDAVEKLDAALQAAGSDAAISPPAHRNLAIALFKRGWKRLRDASGKPGEAAADFERALKDSNSLRGTEPLAYEFSYALALLDAGRPAEAGAKFKQLAAKGGQASYLKPPYNKLGTQLFAAYAAYRGGTLQARQQAAQDLSRIENESSGAFAEAMRQIVAGAWETVGYDQWRNGQPGAAAKAFQMSAKSASGELAKRVELDRAALAIGKDKLGELEAIVNSGGPVEALVDLGIVYDVLGRPKDAYDAWTKAKARGSKAPDLQRWIDSKKRMYGWQ